MAKVTGALFSMDASGKFGGAMVFTKWKGRQVCRQLVIPSNPQTVGQVETRNAMKVAAKAQLFSNLATVKGDSRLVTDKAAIQAITPSGYAWNGYLVEKLVGKGMVNYDAAEAAYTLLTSGNKTTWDVAAAALTPPFTACDQLAAGGGTATPLSAGHVYYLYQYALYTMGIAAAPVAATPPTYA